MATLDDKILGEKLEYYCSSDEGEESENEACDGETMPKEQLSVQPPNYVQTDGTSNTGPKGVIKDWQRYRQLETEQRKEQERERRILEQKLSLTCNPTANEEEDPELQEFLTDQFLIDFFRQRMQELQTKSTNLIQFGRVIQLKTPDEYLDAVDKEQKEVTVIVHVYEDNVLSCRTMSDCLNELAELHKQVKFCKMTASTGGLSRDFKKDGVPALLVYKAGQLIGNYIKLGDEFGVEFTANDVENYLIENGVLLDTAELLKPVN